MSAEVCGSVADWALVFITLVYAICTVFIFLSNRKANKLLKEQISESNKQHEETKHLEILPYLKVECKSSQIATASGLGLKIKYSIEGISNKDENSIKLSLENVGLGTAVNVQYLWALKDLQGNFLLKGSSMLLPNALTIGEKRDVIYYICHPPVKHMIEKNTNHIQLCAGFIYQDMLAAEYRQDILIDMEITENNPEWIIHSCRVEKQKKLETTPEQNT